MGAAENKQIVRSYFERASSGGDPTELLADDVRWWVPPGSRLAGQHTGKAAVLALMGKGFELYSASEPMQVSIEQLVAEDDWVCVQLVIEATTAGGAPYRNHYHFAFQIEAGRIVLVKEYVDTQIANDVLFA